MKSCFLLLLSTKSYNEYQYALISQCFAWQTFRSAEISQEKESLLLKHYIPDIQAPSEEVTKTNIYTPIQK